MFTLPGAAGTLGVGRVADMLPPALFGAPPVVAVDWRVFDAAPANPYWFRYGSARGLLPFAAVLVSAVVGAVLPGVAWFALEGGSAVAAFVRGVASLAAVACAPVVVEAGAAAAVGGASPVGGLGVVERVPVDAVCFERGVAWP